MDDIHHVAGVVERNIGSLIARRRAEGAQRRAQERVADAITRFTGSMPFVYIHLAIFGSWVLINAGLLGPLPRFDPSFVILAMAASVEAIFLSTFVLITQNRMAAQADKRADLDLQISLLSEHEITRLIRLTNRIAGELGIPDSQSPEIRELERDVHPEAVLKKMEDLEKGVQGREQESEARRPP